MSFVLVFFYLVAIVAANNFITYFGPQGLLVTGFVLIPFDLIARDVLQDRWSDLGRLKKFIAMGSLITSGSLLAYLTNHDTAKVSLASAVSFFVAASIEWVVYSFLWNRSRKIRMNVSAWFSAAADSCLFQVIAFGSFSATLAVDQSLIKIVGAFFWTLLLAKYADRIASSGRASNK